jgi:hypothetical protein
VNVKLFSIKLVIAINTNKQRNSFGIKRKALELNKNISSTESEIFFVDALEYFNLIRSRTMKFWNRFSFIIDRNKAELKTSEISQKVNKYLCKNIENISKKSRKRRFDAEDWSFHQTQQVKGEFRTICYLLVKFI